MDVVGHDIGALTMRIASAFGVPLRSFAVDIAPIFHPRFILDFYRSAVPNVAAEWWEDAAGAGEREVSCCSCRIRRRRRRPSG